MLRAARRRARTKGLPFTLTRRDIVIPERCPVLGIALARRHGSGSGPGDGSPTLDRIDSARGYTPDNVVVISWRANRVKNDATSAELFKIARWMQRHGQ